jgi:hypothetical protein
MDDFQNILEEVETCEPWEQQVQVNEQNLQRNFEFERTLSSSDIVNLFTKNEIFVRSESLLTTTSKKTGEISKYVTLKCICSYKKSSFENDSENPRISFSYRLPKERFIIFISLFILYITNYFLKHSFLYFFLYRDCPFRINLRKKGNNGWKIGSTHLLHQNHEPIIPKGHEKLDAENLVQLRELLLAGDINLYSFSIIDLIIFSRNST